MNTIQFLVFIAVTVSLHSVSADESSSTNLAVDTSKWKCKYCVVEEGWNGKLELGVGDVSNTSYKFGEYNGLNESGAFLKANATLFYRDADAIFFDLSAYNLGLNSRALTIEGGQQGHYKLFLNYNEIPHNQSNTVATPYTGTGTSSLSLPGWTSGSTTASMPLLTTTLKNTVLETQRKRLGIGLSLSTDSSWNYAINFRQDKKQGTKRIAGAFFLNTTQLIQPVDYVTDEMDLSLSYTSNRLQANLAYYGSFLVTTIKH